MLSPSVQTGSGSVPLHLFAAPSSSAFIDTPTPVLWFGVGSVLFFFVLVLFLIIRWRVILPARHKTIDKHIFEPAGDDAEITFEDSDFPQPKETETKEAEVTIERAPEHDAAFFEDSSQEEIEPLEFPKPDKRKKKRSAFSKLFSKKQKKQEDFEEETPEPLEEFHGEEQVTEESGFHFGAREDQMVPEHDPLNYSAEELLQNQDDEIENRRREAELEEQTLIFEEQQREQEREEQAQKVRSLTEQSNAMFARERQVASLEERFAGLSTDLNERLEQTALSFKSLQEINHRDTSSMVDHVNRELSSLRSSVNDALEHLTERIDSMNERSADRPEAPREFTRELTEMRHLLLNQQNPDALDRIELSDIIRGALPPEQFDFAVNLSSGYVADSCVSPRDGNAPFAIDAKFPIGAYTHYKRETAEPGKGAHARNEYRRAILSHIVELNRQIIIPGETAMSALLFAPADSIVADLHTNFPDLIQDSYHAHIWIVSPASLMATLHTLIAVRTQTETATPVKATVDNDAEILAEIESLRQRFVDYDPPQEPNALIPEAETLPPEEDAQKTAPIQIEESPEPFDDAQEDITQDAPSPDGQQPKPEPEVQQSPFNPFIGNPYDSGDLHTDYGSIAEEENAFSRLELAEEELAKRDEEKQKTKRPPFPLR